MGLFKNLLENKELNEKVYVNSDVGNVKMLLTETLHFANQLQMWHWLAKSGQKHTALGDFYASLRESIDGIAETLIAQNISLLSGEPKALNVTYSDEVIMYQTNKYREFITNLIEQISIDKADIANIRESLIYIQQNIDKFVYQFDLD